MFTVKLFFFFTPSAKGKKKNNSSHCDLSTFTALPIASVQEEEEEEALRLTADVE